MYIRSVEYRYSKIGVPLSSFKKIVILKIWRQSNYVRRMERYMVPRVKDNNPLGTQKTVSLDFNEE